MQRSRVDDLSYPLMDLTDFYVKTSKIKRPIGFINIGIRNRFVRYQTVTDLRKFIGKNSQKKLNLKYTLRKTDIFNTVTVMMVVYGRKKLTGKICTIFN